MNVTDFVRGHSLEAAVVVAAAAAWFAAIWIVDGVVAGKRKRRGP